MLQAPHMFPHLSLTRPIKLISIHAQSLKLLQLHHPGWDFREKVACGFRIGSNDGVPLRRNHTHAPHRHFMVMLPKLECLLLRNVEIHAHQDQCLLLRNVEIHAHQDQRPASRTKHSPLRSRLRRPCRFQTSSGSTVSPFCARSSDSNAEVLDNTLASRHMQGEPTCISRRISV
jgi:hypothetical protein